MKKYDHKKIEKKWQKYWSDKKIYKTKESEKKPKCYVLDMFPYPSGEGLHVGHVKGYIATDIYSRYKKMAGFNILHPMGWDAFGLPAENFAIKNKIHPKIAVDKNIKKFKSQLLRIGFNYDWSREINTTDPNYYKWTQWIFLQLYKKGLAYESYEPINWCPSCKTGLANEDLDGDRCERCATRVEKKPMRQWMLKITDYAERLLKDLDPPAGGLNWPEHIKEAQRNWIGKSEGVTVRFKLSAGVRFFRSSDLPEQSSGPDTQKSFTGSEYVEVFTTRIDTIFGCTYVVLAPEHEIISNLKSLPAGEAGKISNLEEVEEYIKISKNKLDLQRAGLTKNKTGVELKGLKAINPFNNEELPIWVADYVMADYGTGAVMAVPAHDERDWEFAKKYNLPVKMVICPNYPKPICPVLENAYTGEGHLVDSGEFDGLDSKTAREKMTKWLEEKKLGGRKINYKLKDWVFSRQRYWGEPIPIIHCDPPAGGCGIVPVPEKDLPVELPKVKNYKPTGTGESPLAKIDKWVNVKCPRCGGKARRETNTMPQWAGSSWYHLAYIMRGISNFQFPISKYKKSFQRWMPVDVYVGGAEHATRHLIYARFWHKFLFDVKAVNCKEPFKRFHNVGLVSAEDGRKMSKRWKNVISPDDIVKNYGADALRLYEMFMGSFDQAAPWNSKNIMGVKRFLERIWKLGDRIMLSSGIDKEGNSSVSLDSLLHKTIKKVSEDIEEFKFNTAISTLMILINETDKANLIKVEDFKLIIKMLSPFAPNLAEELWTGLGEKKSIYFEKWPQYDPKKIQEKTFKLIAQVNGKTRAAFDAPFNLSEKEAGVLTLKEENVKKWVAGKPVKKIIFVRNKLINVVTQ